MDKLRDILTEGKKYDAHVISVGKVKPHTGDLQIGWNMYEKPNSSGLYFYLADGTVLLATKGTFKKGDVVQMKDNDSGRKLKWGLVTIQDFAPAIKEKVLEMLLKNKYDYYPTRAFKPKRFKNKLRTAFSVKGHEYSK